MKKWRDKFQLLISTLICCLGLLFFAPAQAAEKRIALVIGNSAYPSAPLKNPVNDARDMAAALRRLGFEVIEKTDATQKEMNRAIVQFGEKLRTDAIALFYYAGHGMQVRGKNYLIPVDAQIASEASARAEAVDVDTVMDQLSASPLNIVILDACRNNPFERRFRGGSGGLAQMDAPKGSLIAYATAPGKVAADGDGRNGLYTQEVLKHIQTPGLPLEAVFKRVRNAVITASAESQTPWESSSLTGDFYFINTGTTAINILTQPQKDSPRVNPEIETWKAAEDANSVEALEAYLRAYPRGKFTAAASIKLSSLKASRKTSLAKPEPFAIGKTESPEDDVWASVEKGNNADDYDAYLTQYPKGKYAVLAKTRKLRQEQKTREQETIAWTAAEAGNNKEAYGAYLTAYPASQYAALAKERLTRLQQEETNLSPYGSDKRILGQWNDHFWYPGTITARNGDLFHVAFDDGDQADLPKARIRRLDWRVNSTVQCNWKSRGRYYPGTITRSNGQAVHINYDDGDKEDTSIGKCRSR